MKKQLITALAALSCLFVTHSNAQNKLESDPAYLPIDKALDLRVVTPKVSVNLPRFLLMDAVSELDLGPEDPFAAAGTSLKEVVGDIKLIRLVIIETDANNKEEVEKGVATLKKQLETNWLPIVSIPEENVGVYILSDPSGEQIAGLAVLVFDGGDAVIGNIVGKISIGKILKVATKVKGDGSSFIPKDLLQKLSNLSTPTKPPQEQTEKQ